MYKIAKYYEIKLFFELSCIVVMFFLVFLWYFCYPSGGFSEQFSFAPYIKEMKPTHCDKPQTAVRMPEMP